MPDFEQGILSVRFRHPDKGEMEVQINKDDQTVDVVFTTVDAVNKILLPSFSARYPHEASELRARVEAQRSGEHCFVIHQYSCRSAVPAINWDAKSPIKLGPAEWLPARPESAR